MAKINIKIEPKYNQGPLLDDGSVDWSGFNRDDLLARIRKEQTGKAISRLRHTEVRYEVTDNCNAECIMCPRDLHKLGRPHGVMDLARYKKSIDEVVSLG